MRNVQNQNLNGEMNLDVKIKEKDFLDRPFIVLHEKQKNLEKPAIKAEWRLTMIFQLAVMGLAQFARNQSPS